MPVILCRHGATAKNLEGGTDNRWTPLHAEGIRQASQTGPRLVTFCQANNITRVKPVTSGYDRTNATCVAALEAFSGKNIEILSTTQDERVGEIKFRPREIHPTSEIPGIFGRVIDGPPLAEILARLTAFETEQLQDTDPATLTVIFGHRTTHRLLAMIHLKRDIGWMEALPRMDNCELWLLQNMDMQVLHPGYPTPRDAPDPRRDTLK